MQSVYYLHYLITWKFLIGLRRFSYLSTYIMGSKLTGGMDVCQRYSVMLTFVRTDLTTD
jgi:hypothetical protein